MHDTVEHWPGLQVSQFRPITFCLQKQTPVTGSQPVLPNWLQVQLIQPLDDVRLKLLQTSNEPQQRKDNHYFNYLYDTTWYLNKPVINVLD